MPRPRLSIYNAATGVGGGDGHDYFAILPPVPELIEAIKTLDSARTECLKLPDKTEGRVRATAIDYVIKEVGDKVKVAGRLSAIETQALIQERVEATQKRPDRLRGRPGLRLRDAIRCRPLPTVIPGGGVGIGDMVLLEQVMDVNGQSFWRTQEFGSSHLVGKTLYGLFEQPGRARPNPTQFRTHAIFTPGGKNSGKMTINRPIPERAFLREGAEAGDVVRMKLLGDAVQNGIVELKAILDGSSARLAPLRQVVR